MPSSLIFAGLVVIWLLILVPAVARRQQEVVRPSPAALSGRVLARPVRHRTLEVYGMDTDDDRAAVATGAGPDPEARVPAAREAAHDERDEPADREDTAVQDDHEDHEERDDRDDHADVDRADDGYETDADEADDERDLEGATAGDPDEGYAAAGYYSWDEDGGGADPARHEPRNHADLDERRWERPPASFRPGRGGFDPEAAALAARARYAFRQRVVIALLVLAVVTAGAALLVLPALWWVHGLVDLGLVGYLVYLRRQVRMEEAIRARRAARMAGTRRPSAADDPALDDWARRGRDAAATSGDDEDGEFEERGHADEERGDPADAGHEDGHGESGDDEDWTADDGEPDRVRGTGEPVGVLPAKRRTVDGDQSADAGFEPALPRLQPAPPPPLPAGTELVDVDADDEELPLDTGGSLRGAAGAYRRAAGE